MKKILALLATIILCAVSLTPTFVSAQKKTPKEPEAKFRQSANAIPNRYIVVLEDPAAGPNGALSKAPEIAAEMSRANGGTVKHVYTHALNGFAVEMSEDAALALANTDPRVKYIQEDAEVFATQVQSDPPWGLDRIDQRDRPLDNTFNYTPTGAGVNAYVLDTGIRPTHVDFGGRASIVLDVIGDGQEGVDCHGHGTHVAGSIGGSTYGVAKDVSLYVLRVLGCSGSGSIAGVIEAVDWVTANHVKPAVANMSLGAQGSFPAMEEAIQNSIAAGVTYVLAAGNNNMNACNFSPARVQEAITVGATTSFDSRSSFSNWGTCVDIFAPGSSIQSAWWTSDTATNTISGTSMASPHVAGVAALYLQDNPDASSDAVTTAILETSTTGRLSGIGTGSPNKLLYSPLTGGGGGGDPCTACEPYSGFLSGTGDAQIQPNGDYYQSTSSGYHNAWLRGPADADFDLYLFWWNGSQWVTVASSEGATSEEQISFSGIPGYYYWRIYSYSGSGDYNFWMQRP